MKEICWASKDSEIYQNFLWGVPLEHWSRRFEYPWILAKGDFCDNQVTLDAAGGDAPLQWFLSGKTGVVWNVDIDAQALERGKQKWNRANVIRREDDLKSIGSMNGLFCEGFFDRVVCASVLEHSFDHMEILKELWWVLRKGGRMLLTFDVASYERWNHNIDFARANKIAAMFDLEIPPEPKDVLKAVFPEIQRKENDPESVELKVLCIAIDKE